MRTILFITVVALSLAACAETTITQRASGAVETSIRPQAKPVKQKWSDCIEWPNDCDGQRTTEPLTPPPSAPPA
jgi:hypothetical protein